jgi:hypothetical protein
MTQHISSMTKIERNSYKESAGGTNFMLIISGSRNFMNVL